MRLPRFDHTAPGSLTEVFYAYSRHPGKAALLAGGTDLLVRLRQRTATPELVISLNSIPGLDYISKSPAGVRIGTLTPLHSLETSPIIRQDLGILADCASKIASPQVRNSATLSGNLCLETRCWYYNKSSIWRQARPLCFKTGGTLCHVVKGGKSCYSLFTGDMAPALMVLGATAQLSNGKGQRTILLQALYTGDGQKPLAFLPGEIVTEVQLPFAPPNSGSCYLKHSFRKAVDFAIASVAALITLDKDGVCTDARIALGSVASAPVRAVKAENVLKGNKLVAALAEKAAGLAVKDIGPIVAIGPPVDYKKKVITFIVSRAIQEAAEAARCKMRGKN